MTHSVVAAGSWKRVRLISRWITLGFLLQFTEWGGGGREKEEECICVCVNGVIVDSPKPPPPPPPPSLYPALRANDQVRRL